MKTAGLLLLLIGVGLLAMPAAYGVQTIVTPRFTIAEEYTDNMFLAHENPEEEWITLVSPGISLGLLWQTAGLELSYDPAYAYYQEHDEYTTWRHAAAFSGWTQLSRYSRLDARDDFFHTEDPITVEDTAVARTTEPGLPLDTTFRRGRNPYSRNIGSVTFTHQFGRSDFLRLGYLDNMLINDEPTLQDSSAHQPWAGLTYWFTPTWGFELGASYTLGEYEVTEDIEQWQGSVGLLKRFSRTLIGRLGYMHSLVHYDGLSERDITYNPFAGIDYFLREDASLTFNIGYFVNEFERRPDESGLTGEIRLIKLYPRGRLDLSVLSGYNYDLFATNETEGFAKFTEAAVSTTYFLSRYVSSYIFGSYRYSDYVDLDRTDDLARMGFGLNWMPYSWMLVDLTYAHNLADSSEDFASYNENRVHLGVTLSPRGTLIDRLRLENPINPNFPTGETAQ